MLNFTRSDLTDLTESEYSTFLRPLQSTVAGKTSILTGLNFKQNSSDVGGRKGDGKEGMAAKMGKTDTHHACK